MHTDKEIYIFLLTFKSSGWRSFTKKDSEPDFNLLNYCKALKYVVGTNGRYELTEKGYGFLENFKPTQMPPIADAKTQTLQTQYGNDSNSIFTNEFMLYFIYPLLVLLIGSLLLKIFGIL